MAHASTHKGICTTIAEGARTGMGLTACIQAALFNKQKCLVCETTALQQIGFQAKEPMGMQHAAPSNLTLNSEHST